MSYYRQHRRLRGMGDLSLPALPSLSLTDPTTTFLSGISTSPWLYVAGGLLVFFMVRRSFGNTGRGRRVTNLHRLSPFTVAIYAAGAGAGGYLLGRYTTI